MTDDLTTNNLQLKIRSFAYVLVAVMCFILAVSYLCPAYIWSSPSLEITINDSINPNDAPVGSLIRLPGIGLSRANAIVDYRNKIESHGRQRAFNRPDDLCDIRGIGIKTVEEISPYLNFDRVE